MNNEEKVLLAKKVLRNRDAGVLSTLHAIEGELFPYGSICPFISTSKSKVAILISGIALHTKNILENSRVGFTVFDMEAKNKQAASRVSLMGKVCKVDPKERKDYQEIELHGGRNEMVLLTLPLITPLRPTIPILRCRRCCSCCCDCVENKDGL